MTSLAQDRTTVDTLSVTQITILVASGIVFWFLAALLIRAIEPLGALEGSAVPLLYALVVPGTWPALWLIRRLATLRGDQTALGVTIATATALLFDGCALRAIPALYGANTAGAGAAILWGAGVALFLGIVMNRS